MKVLIDENLPRKLVEALRAEEHEAESVHTLHQQGIDNGALYALACRDYDVLHAGRGLRPQRTPGRSAGEIEAAAGRDSTTMAG